MLRVRVSDGREDEFLRRYEALSERIAQGLAGHIVHQLCQSTSEPDRWLLASHWEDAKSAEAWERSPEHRELTMPLRECWDEAERTAYVVKLETVRRG